MEKDYSLLRPFDLEAAKRGEALVDSRGIESKYIAGPHSVTQEIVVECGDHCGFVVYYAYRLHMAPLAWVEGKPVYKGDVLYWNAQRTSPCVAEKIMDGGWLAFRASDNEPYGLIHPDGLTWTPPKVKREIKMLAWLCDSCLCWMAEGFPVNKGYIRVPSEDKVIEIEESTDEWN